MIFWETLISNITMSTAVNVIIYAFLFTDIKKLISAIRKRDWRFLFILLRILILWATNILKDTVFDLLISDSVLNYIICVISGGILPIFLFPDFKLHSRIVLAFSLVAACLAPSISAMYIDLTFLPIIIRFIYLFATTCFFKKFRYTFRQNFSKYFALIVIVSTIITISSAFTFYETMSTGSFDYFTIITILLEIAFFSIYYVFFTLSKNNEALIKADAVNHRLQYEKEEFMLNKKNEEEIRMLRHDMKNQFSYIAHYLENDDLDSAKEYFSKLVENQAQSLNQVHSGNTTIDYALNLATEKGKTKKKTIREDIVVPSELRIDAEKLYSVLINLLDNAIEHSGDEQAIINIRIKVKGNYLFISVDNPTELTAIPDSGLKSKKEGNGHGYGVKIIQKITEEYDGYYENRIENGRFVADVMMRLEDDE